MKLLREMNDAERLAFTIRQHEILLAKFQSVKSTDPAVVAGLHKMIAFHEVKLAQLLAVAAEQVAR